MEAMAMPLERGLSLILSCAVKNISICSFQRQKSCWFLFITTIIVCLLHQQWNKLQAAPCSCHHSTSGPGRGWELEECSCSRASERSCSGTWFSAILCQLSAMFPLQ